MEVELLNNENSLESEEIYNLICDYIDISNRVNRKILEHKVDENYKILKSIFVSDKSESILNNVYNDTKDEDLKEFIFVNFELNESSSWEKIFELRKSFINGRFNELIDDKDIDNSVDDLNDVLDEYGVDLEESIDNHIYDYGMSRTSDKDALDMIMYKSIESDLDVETKLNYCNRLLKAYLDINSKIKKLRKS